MADDLKRPYAYPFEPASEDAIAMKDGAAAERPAGTPSSYDRGSSVRWTPESISEVHALSRLGRYQIRGFNTFNHRMPTFDDLTFVPATMTRLPLEGYRESCDTKTVLGNRPGLVAKPLELDIPIYIASMSFGALSANAKAALGYGASKLGTMTCTGEGGMLEDERAASQKLVYQMTPSRYMLDLEHLRMADGIELVMGQGAKPGTGGILLGMKVSDRVAEMRTLPKGVDQRSSVRHPDFLGADDLQVKIEELREATDYQVPIIIKVGATRPRFDVAIAAKAGADVIVVDGAEGGTGASPELLLDHTGTRRLRQVGRGLAGRRRRHTLRHRRRKMPGAGRRRGDDRHRRPDGAGLQLAALFRRLRRPRHRARALPSLPHRALPGRHHDPGPGTRETGRRGRGRRARRALPDGDDHGDHPPGQGLRQVSGP